MKPTINPPKVIPLVLAALLAPQVVAQGNPRGQVPPPGYAPAPNYRQPAPPPTIGDALRGIGNGIYTFFNPPPIPPAQPPTYPRYTQSDRNQRGAASVRPASGASAARTANYGPPSGYRPPSGYGSAPATNHVASAPVVRGVPMQSSPRVASTTPARYQPSGRVPTYSQNLPPAPRSTQPLMASRSATARPPASVAPTSATSSGRLPSTSRSAPAPQTKPPSKPSPSRTVASTSKPKTAPATYPKPRSTTPKPASEDRPPDPKKPAVSSTGSTSKPKPKIVVPPPSKPKTGEDPIKKTLPPVEDEPPGPKPDAGDIEPTQPKEKPAPSSGSAGPKYLVAKKTDKDNRVVSPHPPYHELDITGLQSGQLAIDPKTSKVFRVP